MRRFFSRGKQAIQMAISFLLICVDFAKKFISCFAPHKNKFFVTSPDSPAGATYTWLRRTSTISQETTQASICEDSPEGRDTLDVAGQSDGMAFGRPVRKMTTDTLDVAGRHL